MSLPKFLHTASNAPQVVDEEFLEQFFDADKELTESDEAEIRSRIPSAMHVYVNTPSFDTMLTKPLRRERKVRSECVDL